MFFFPKWKFDFSGLIFWLQFPWRLFMWNELCLVGNATCLVICQNQKIHPKNLEIFTDFRQPSAIIHIPRGVELSSGTRVGTFKTFRLDLARLGPHWWGSIGGQRNTQHGMERYRKPETKQQEFGGPPCGNRPCDGHLKIWKGKFIFQSINFRGFLLLVSGRLNILQCNHSECEQMRHHNMNRFVFFSQQIQMQWVEEPPLMSLFSLHIVNHHWKKRHEMTEVTNPNIKTTISNHHVRTLPEYETFEQKKHTV